MTLKEILYGENAMRRDELAERWLNSLKINQNLMVENAGIARALDEQIDNVQQLHHFIETFKNRYPNAYEDIVLESQKV